MTMPIWYLLASFCRSEMGRIVLSIGLLAGRDRLPELRQRVNDYETGIYCRLDPFLNIIEAALIGARPFRGKCKLRRPLFRKGWERRGQAALQPSPAILERKVQNLA